AAKMAKLSNYGLHEYPEPQSLFDYFMGSREETMKNETISKELGPAGVKTYNSIRSLKEMIGVTQTRLPFTYHFNE
ncbi:MAG TPA: hypothetical protein VK625_18600, partial [Flavitalea sp.]|nr:hypothetical protein [Flavitalea sp.]